MCLKVNKKLIAEYDCKNCGSFLTVLLCITLLNVVRTLNFDQ